VLESRGVGGSTAPYDCGQPLPTLTANDLWKGRFGVHLDISGTVGHIWGVGVQRCDQNQPSTTTGQHSRSQVLDERHIYVVICSQPVLHSYICLRAVRLQCVFTFTTRPSFDVVNVWTHSDSAVNGQLRK